MGSDVNINGISRFGERFFDQVDRFISEQWRVLRCGDVSDAYFSVYNSSKHYRGNASGFSGVSEFLIFRILYHMLGGAFEARPHTRDTTRFVSVGDDGFWIGQSVRLTVQDKRYYPDIILFHSGDLIGIVQVKVCLTNGIRELRHEVTCLKAIKQQYRNLYAILLIFGDLARRGTVRPELDRNKKELKWFDYVGLRETEEPIHCVFDRSLNLGRIREAMTK